LLLVAGFPATAQQKTPTKAQIDIAREVIVIKGVHKIFDAVIPGVIEQDKNTLLSQNPGLQKDLTDISLQLRTEYAPRVNDVITQVATIYAGYFTEQELKDLLAFYKSPLGQKITAQDPEALDRGMRAGQDWAIKFSDEVMSRMRVELKKKGHDL
ncbi:MAG: DUF2059 domain-containing protein, partial [Pseudolabrys sp.]|nr:DUF2059 domain-containing protein [Pseudolabrys sp.]